MPRFCFDNSTLANIENQNSYLCTMGNKQDIKTYISALKKRLKKEMPKVREEIRNYEEKLAQNKLTKNPTPGPQFNV
jgi:hypothetical protein